MSTKRLYHFYFLGITEPITVQSNCSAMARHNLKQILLNLPDYHNVPVIDERTEALVPGVTTRINKGITLIWTGEDWKPKK